MEQRIAQSVESKRRDQEIHVNMAEEGENSPNKVVVCDNGTGFVKAGYAAENFPRHQFPSMVGRPVLRDGCDPGTDVKYLPSGEEVPLDAVMCGDKAELWLEALDINYPMTNGVVRK